MRVWTAKGRTIVPESLRYDEGSMSTSMIRVFFPERCEHSKKRVATARKQKRLLKRRLSLASDY